MIRRLLLVVVILAVVFNSVFPVRVYNADKNSVDYRAGRALIVASDFGIANFLTGDELDRLRELNPGNRTLGRSEDSGWAVWDRVQVDWDFLICTNLALISVAGLLFGLNGLGSYRKRANKTRLDNPLQRPESE